MPVSAYSYQYAYGFNKQADLETEVPDAHLTLCTPQDNFGAIGNEYPNQLGDGALFGKGHPFATWWDPITKRFTVPERTFSLTPNTALFAPGFVLGSKSSTGTTVFTHVFSFLDVMTSQNCLSTTMVEKNSAEKMKVTGLVINGFKLEMSRTDHVKISWDGVARDMVADADFSMPSVTQESNFFKTLGATFKFGDNSGTVATVSSSVLGCSLQVSQNPNFWEMPGEASADQGKISLATIGKQQVTGSISVFFDATFMGLFRNRTECGLEITMEAGLIGAGPDKYTVVASIPHLQIPSASVSQEGDMVALKLDFNDQTVFKHSTDPVFSWSVKTDTAGTDLLTVAT